MGFNGGRVEHNPGAVAALVARIARLEPDPAEVRVVIETRHGLLVEALVDAGYRGADTLHCSHSVLRRADVMRDLYPWAGELRSVVIAKADVFCLSSTHRDLRR